MPTEEQEGYLRFFKSWRTETFQPYQNEKTSARAQYKAMTIHWENDDEENHTEEVCSLSSDFLT